MTKKQTIHSMFMRSNGWTIDKPKFSPPKIVKEFFQDAIRMYLCEGKRLFIADTYDRMFVSVKLKVIPKRISKLSNYKR